MWHSCPSPFRNSPLMSASPQIGISYGSPEFVGEKDQTDNLSSCWGFLGSSSICIPQECCSSICLCLQTPQQCPMQDSATSHCLSNTAKGKIEVSRWPPQFSFQTGSCGAVVPSSWWGHRYTCFPIQQFCSCYSSFWDAETSLYGQSLDLKEVAKNCFRCSIEPSP